MPRYPGMGTDRRAQDAFLYLNNEEIHAAVNVCEEIAERHRNKPDFVDPFELRLQLREDLIEFFGAFDRARTDQLKSLQERLLDALRRAAAPAMLLPKERT